jgi:phosphatidylserine/phosphatidylglycerophosphate/cardiolipin synthase-like enzyme
MSRLQDLCSVLDEMKLARLGAALWSNIGKRVELEGLTWAVSLLGPSGDRLLYEVLQESGVLDQDGKVSTIALSRCLETLAGGDPLRPGEFAVVWTLPSQHPDFDVLGYTYKEAVISVIESANREIIMTSPFLQERGMNFLMGSLTRALWRGVEITILTHDVSDVGSVQSRAMEKLRKEASFQRKRLCVYAARPDLGYLLHAKIFVADEESFVMGSANITGQGFCGHIECGVVGRTPQAKQVNAILKRTISSGMAKLIFSTRDIND